MDYNFAQGMVFRECIKGDGWAFWKGKETVPCVKIKGYFPNKGRTF